MLPKVGARKGDAAYLYEKALHAGSEAEVLKIVASMPQRAREWLGRYEQESLWPVFAGAQDMRFTSQAAEAMMQWALQMGLWGMNPSQLLTNVVDLTRDKFMNCASAADMCKGRVPPRINDYIAAQAREADEKYKDTVMFHNGNREASVKNIKTGCERRMNLDVDPHRPPVCCDHSKGASGMPSSGVYGEGLEQKRRSA